MKIGEIGGAPGPCALPPDQLAQFAVALRVDDQHRLAGLTVNRLHRHHRKQSSLDGPRGGRHEHVSAQLVQRHVQVTFRWRDTMNVRVPLLWFGPAQQPRQDLQLPRVLFLQLVEPLHVFATPHEPPAHPDLVGLHLAHQRRGVDHHDSLARQAQAPPPHPGPAPGPHADAIGRKRNGVPHGSRRRDARPHEPPAQRNRTAPAGHRVQLVRRSPILVVVLHVYAFFPSGPATPIALARCGANRMYGSLGPGPFTSPARGSSSTRIAWILHCSRNAFGDICPFNAE